MRKQKLNTHYQQENPGTGVWNLSLTIYSKKNEERKQAGPGQNRNGEAQGGVNTRGPPMREKHKLGCASWPDPAKQRVLGKPETSKLATITQNDLKLNINTRGNLGHKSKNRHKSQDGRCPIMPSWGSPWAKKITPKRTSKPIFGIQGRLRTRVRPYA